MFYATSLPFGKHRGKPLSAVPTGYLRWLQRSEDLESWLLGEVEAELARRGVRAVDAVLVLHHIEEEIYERISDDPDIDHALAGVVTDHVMEALESVRRRHGIGEVTTLTIAPNQPGSLRPLLAVPANA